MLLPREPPLRVADGFAVVLPRGGGGTPAAPAPPARRPKPSRPRWSPRLPRRAGRAQAAAEGRAAARRAAAADRAQRQAPGDAAARPRDAHAADGASAAAAGGTTPAARGAASATPGLEFGPPGPGRPRRHRQRRRLVPGRRAAEDLDDLDPAAQVRLHAARRRDVHHPAERQVTDVRVTQSCGVSLLDLAAQRAVLYAAPFGPLPRTMENPRTIQALFKPGP